MLFWRFLRHGLKMYKEKQSKQTNIGLLSRKNKKIILMHFLDKKENIQKIKHRCKNIHALK